MSTKAKDKIPVPLSAVPYTLLHAFMKKKRAEYVPVPRKGTRKGDPIGFGKAKYRASLQCLHDIPSRDFTFRRLSKLIHVSYELLRKWHTEKVFLKQVKAHENEFVGFLMEFVKTWSKREWENSEARLKQPIKTIAKANALQIMHKAIDELREKMFDAFFYNPRLRFKIFLVVQAEVEKARKRYDLAWIMDLNLVLQFLQKPGSESQELKDLKNKINQKIADEWLQRVKKILCGSPASLEERKNLVVGLNMIQRTIKGGGF